MNFIKYCELPENEQWITQFMYTMKLDTGYDEQALIEAVYEQVDLDDVLLDAGYMEDADYSKFLANWYDELETPDEREFPPRSGAV